MFVDDEIGCCSTTGADGLRSELARQINHPMIADMIYEMEIEIRAIRAMVMEAAIAYDWMYIAKAKGDEASYKKWKKRYRRLKGHRQQLTRLTVTDIVTA